MLSSEEILLIIYFVSIILLLVIVFVIFFIAFQKRKNKFLVERLEAEKEYEFELEQSRREIQEQTLRNIAWELHDNIGQKLSVANLELNVLASKSPDELRENIEETKNIVGETVMEIRSLSKILNAEIIQKNGLIKSLDVELERFNRLNFLNANKEITGEERPINDADEIIIFRILQEFFSNVIKHAKANNLFVTLNYGVDSLTIVAKDDGIGFDLDQITDNSGLRNMKSRAEIIKAQFDLNSSPGQGTNLELIYPYR